MLEGSAEGGKRSPQMGLLEYLFLGFHFTYQALLLCEWQSSPARCESERSQSPVLVTYPSVGGGRKAGSDSVESWDLSRVFWHPVVQWDCAELCHTAAAPGGMEPLWSA